MYDLAAYYIRQCIGKPVNKDYTQKLIIAFNKILANGYTIKDIYDEISRCNTNRKFNKFIFTERKAGDDSNLMSPNVFYYHKNLKIMPLLDKVDHDINAGTMTSNNDEFYLEQTASYTLNELISYGYSRNAFPTGIAFNENRVKGMVRSFINTHGLDIVLFMIESASRSCDTGEPVKDFTELQNHLQVAQSYLGNSKSNSKYAGGDYVIPRKRTEFRD